MRLILGFWKDRSGVTAIEYALIGGIISAGLIAALGSIGSQVSNNFSSASSGLN